jgi:hypothetical protein
MIAEIYNAKYSFNRANIVLCPFGVGLNRRRGAPVLGCFAANPACLLSGRRALALEPSHELIDAYCSKIDLVHI